MEDVLRSYEGKRVLVTGGCGCIGSNLVKALLKTDGERVVVLDDLSASFEWNLPGDSRVVLIRGSVLDEERLRRAFSFKTYEWMLTQQAENRAGCEVLG